MDGPQQLLTRQDVQRLCRISKTTLYRLLRSGQFPRPIRIGPRAVRWCAGELNRWLAGRPRSPGDGIHRGAKAV